MPGSGKPQLGDTVGDKCLTNWRPKKKPKPTNVERNGDGKKINKKTCTSGTFIMASVLHLVLTGIEMNKNPQWAVLVPLQTETLVFIPSVFLVSEVNTATPQGVCVFFFFTVYSVRKFACCGKLSCTAWCQRQCWSYNTVSLRQHSRKTHSSRHACLIRYTHEILLRVCIM